MEITNELLAAYAEGNVSESERKAVRLYLTEHPNQLETVMMMMDEDYDLSFDDETAIEDVASASSEGSFSDICYSAAAFAPRVVPMKNSIKSPKYIEQKCFDDRLGDLLDELNL